MPHSLSVCSQDSICAADSLLQTYVHVKPDKYPDKIRFRIPDTVTNNDILRTVPSWGHFTAADGNAVISGDDVTSCDNTMPAAGKIDAVCIQTPLIRKDVQVLAAYML
jgi:hypothetical protein